MTQQNILSINLKRKQHTHQQKIASNKEVGERIASIFQKASIKVTVGPIIRFPYEATWSVSIPKPSGRFPRDQTYGNLKNQKELMSAVQKELSLHAKNHLRPPPP